MIEDRDPTYAFVPGGPFPRPVTEAEKPEAIAEGRWWESAAYLRGIGLFNGGFYWEAHEVWEGLWHAHGRSGPIADTLKGLIKLAAAGVKVRQRQRHGVETHAHRAARSFEAAGPGAILGLDLEEMARIAREVEARPPEDPATADEAVARVFGFRIEPRQGVGSGSDHRGDPAPPPGAQG